MLWFGLGGGLLPEPLAFGLQKQREPPLKIPFTENIRVTLHGLRLLGMHAREFGLERAEGQCTASALHLYCVLTAGDQIGRQLPHGRDPVGAVLETC